MTIEEMFEKWFNTEMLPAECDDERVVVGLKMAFLAGMEAQRKKDAEISMECARTVPKSIGQQHGRHHSAGCQRVAAAIEKG